MSTVVCYCIVWWLIQTLQWWMSREQTGSLQCRIGICRPVFRDSVYIGWALQILEDCGSQKPPWGEVCWSPLPLRIQLKVVLTAPQCQLFHRTSVCRFITINDHHVIGLVKKAAVVVHMCQTFRINCFIWLQFFMQAWPGLVLSEYGTFCFHKAIREPKNNIQTYM